MGSFGFLGLCGGGNGSRPPARGCGGLHSELLLRVLTPLGVREIRLPNTEVDQWPRTGQ
ncbi:hypothetical protein SPW_7851 [Streptomyces sp. W007]|nr:hypothetical protein SPW_7851 [Streptomyces sp. W007]